MASSQFTNFSPEYTHELHAAIGRFLLVCATGEQFLGFQLARATLHPNPMTVRGWMMFHGMETKIKLERICMAAPLIAETKSDEIIRTCDKIRNLYSRRNDICHNTNLMGDGDKLTLTVFKGFKRPIVKIYTIPQINLFCDHLIDRLRCIDSLLTDAGVTPIPTQAN